MKRGQLKLSFGMIFSIILIIVFIAFAFYAIGMILDFDKTVNVGKFVNDFQSDVNDMWVNEGSQEYTYSLSDEVEEVCFDESKILFKPLGVGGDSDYTEIEHLDIEEDFCIENVDGKIKIRIKRDDAVLLSIEAWE